MLNKGIQFTVNYHEFCAKEGTLAELVTRRHPDLNRRLLDLQSRDLPLSYTTLDTMMRNSFNNILH